MRNKIGSLFLAFSLDIIYVHFFNACHIHEVDRRCSVIFPPEKQFRIACPNLLRWVAPEPELAFTSSDLNSVAVLKAAILLLARVI